MDFKESITGNDIVQEDPESGRRKFEFFKGPLFTNLLLGHTNHTPDPPDNNADIHAKTGNFI